MTWQQYKEEWVRLNTCRFCIGSHLHTCTSYQCKPAVRKAEKYFESVIVREEIKLMKRKYVTDLRPWFTERLKIGNIVTGIWIISDEEKKQIVVRFNAELSGMERMAYLRCITQSLMNTAAVEDAKEDGESGFGNLMDMMQLREWQKEDDEILKNGIPHEIGEESERMQEKTATEIWYEFYMNFNDDNLRHAELSFMNNNFKNEIDIFKANVNWVKEIVANGITPDEILQCIPDAERFVKIYLEEQRRQQDDE